MCLHGGHMCICIPNMKFLCLTLCQGEVCTDDNDNANIDIQSMVVEGSLVDKPNEPKPGKMERHFPVREKSGNFAKTGKSLGILPKILEKNLEKLCWKIF